MSQPEAIEASQKPIQPHAVVRSQDAVVLPFLVRDRSRRHLDHPAHTEEQALAIVEYFTLHDPDSRCYIMQNPGVHPSDGASPTVSGATRCSGSESKG